ncbi:MAG: hypothetical protein ABSC23_06930 [Bryobacteraceae bacterium]|jgi:hypothetical protein
MDRAGLRLVFPLGNLLQSCPYNCRFCGVKTTLQTSADEARRRFDELWAAYRQLGGGPFHPVIYNGGNVTNPREFSSELLLHVLETFRGERDIQYLSLNSREADASPEVLDRLASLYLPYPMHFIFGVESFSARAAQLLGKDTRGELHRFIAKLKPRNLGQRKLRPAPKSYLFGLDVNLVFLPELYLEDGHLRQGHASEIERGIVRDLEHLLAAADPDVPIQVNLHPFYWVPALPFADSSLAQLIGILPALQALVERHNVPGNRAPSHLFVGVEGTGYGGDDWRRQIDAWGTLIDEFNRTGAIRC